MSDADRKRDLKRAYKEGRKAQARRLMPLDSDQLDHLLDSLEEQDVDARCDHSLRLTMAWAAENGVDQGSLAVGLNAFGGYCDCEVLANVDPDVFR